VKVSSTFKIAFRALRRNKLRSGLTALGIIIGVGAVIVTISIGNGAKSQVEEQIASMGQNVILIFSGSSSSGGVRSGYGGAGTLTMEDAEAIKREIPLILNLSPEVRSSSNVVAGNQNWYVRNVLGESADYFDIRQWPIIEGTAYTEIDVRSANKVAVIGQTVSDQLFGNDSPIGQVIRIRNVPFIVVGLLSKKGLSVMGSDQDDTIIIPYTSTMKRLTGETSLRSINVQVGKASDLEHAQSQIVSLLQQRHKTGGNKPDDFTVHNQEEIAKAATETSRVMTILLAVIASTSLLVGGIGIMNIMLVSVTERTREIGIRMAVGAHGKDILLQFLIEAVSLSSMGGILGILLGFGVSKAVSTFAGWPTLISTGPVLLSFLFSALVGIFFGFYPARKAAQLDPIDALRYE